MAGKGKGKSMKMSTPAPGGRKTTSSKTRHSLSEKAGLVFPVARIAKHLQKGRYTKRVGKRSAVFMGAVLEYLTAELLELAGNISKGCKRARIIPRHLQMAIRNDEELNSFLSNVVLPNGGVLPHIHEVLVTKKSSTADSQKAESRAKSSGSKKPPAESQEF